MATANVRIQEVRASTYKQGDTLQFYIDGASVPMLDPTNTYLRMNLNVGGKGVQTGYNGANVDIGHQFPYTLNTKIGAESLIRQLTIKTIGDDVILEQIQHYNILCRTLANNIQNDTMNNLKRLYGGADTLGVVKDNTLTIRTPNDNTNTQENLEVEVLIPLSCSGILGGKNREPLPVAALGGVVVEVLLENDVYKCVRFQGASVMDDPEGVQFRGTKNVQQKVLGYETATSYKVQSATINPGFNSNAAVDCELQVAPVGATGTLASIDSADDSLTTPFYNGCTAVLGLSTGEKEVVIRKVDNNNNRVRLTFTAADFTGNLTADPIIYIKPSTSTPDINLSNVEIICGVADVSADQMSSLSGAVSSGGGYSYTYPSFGHFGVNLSANALRTSSYIPANYRQAVMILSAWENIQEASDPLKDNLCPPVDDSTKPLSYQFIINNLLVPTREVDLSRYNNTRAETGGWGQTHIKQLTDALHCGGYVTRDLSDIDGCLTLGQCFAPRPHTADLSSAEGETRLNINYSVQTRALLLHNFVHHIKTLVIKPQQRMVLE